MPFFNHKSHSKPALHSSICYMASQEQVTLFNPRALSVPSLPIPLGICIVFLNNVANVPWRSQLKGTNPHGGVCGAAHIFQPVFLSFGFAIRCLQTQHLSVICENNNANVSTWVGGRL